MIIVLTTIATSGINKCNCEISTLQIFVVAAMFIIMVIIMLLLIVMKAKTS